MTDKEALLELLNRFGVKPSAEPFIHMSDGDYANKLEQTVVLTAGDVGVDGHSSFYTQFDFDEDGNFEGVGIWE